MRLRTCPLCRSKAVSAVERIEDEAATAYVEIRCGECGTWRGGCVTPRRADRIERRLRRDRERMAVSAWQSERWRDLDLAQLAQGSPQGARRKTYR